MDLRFSVLSAFVASAALLGSAGTARAQFDIDEPEAEQGSVELEYNGDYHFGNPRRRVVEEGGEIIADENEVLRQRHVFAIGLGLTNYFKLSVEAEFEQERLDDIDDLALANSFGDLEATEIQFEGIAVLRPLKKDGLGAALFISYVAALGDDDPNQFQIGPILKVAQGPWSATTSAGTSSMRGRQNTKPRSAGLSHWRGSARSIASATRGARARRSSCSATRTSTGSAPSPTTPLNIRAAPRWRASRMPPETTTDRRRTATVMAAMATEMTTRGRR
jgi:hypothetical protein